MSVHTFRSDVGENPSLELYLQQIGAIPLLTRRQEVVLARRIEEGDEDALQRMIRANLRFVVFLAKKFQHQGLSLADLINEGNIGLIKAAKRFDHSMGVRFTSYAAYWIRQTILLALEEQVRIVRLPRKQIEGITKFDRALACAEQRLGRQPDLNELAAETEKTGKFDTETWLWHRNWPLSLDEPFIIGEDSSLHDVLGDERQPAPDEMLSGNDLYRAIRKTLDELTPREAEIITLYFDLDHAGRCLTLDEIGVRLRLTRERVRQLKKKAIRRLRQRCHGTALRKFFDEL